MNSIEGVIDTVYVFTVYLWPLHCFDIMMILTNSCVCVCVCVCVYICLLVVKLRSSEFPESYYIQTALHFAAYGGVSDCVSTILEEGGAGVNLQIVTNCPFKHWPCCNKRVANKRLVN